VAISTSTSHQRTEDRTISASLVRAARL
jgi:hypothetical protein